MSRKPIPTEHEEQSLVVNYLQVQYPQVLFWSTPNGMHLAGSRGQRAAQINKEKNQGMLPGVSDLIIFEPMGGYACMFLEMKRRDGGDGPSENQLWFIREVEKRGAIGFVANGYDEAKILLDDYLAGKMVMVSIDDYLMDRQQARAVPCAKG